MERLIVGAILGWAAARLADPVVHRSKGEVVLTQEQNRRLVRATRRSRRNVRSLRRQLRTCEAAIEAAGLPPALPPPPPRREAPAPPPA